MVWVLCMATLPCPTRIYICMHNKYKTSNTKYWISNSKYWAKYWAKYQNTLHYLTIFSMNMHSTAKTRYRIQNTNCQFLNTQYWIPDIKYQIANTNYLIPKYKVMSNQHAYHYQIYPKEHSPSSDAKNCFKMYWWGGLSSNGWGGLSPNGWGRLTSNGWWGCCWYGWGGRSSAGTLPPRRNAGPKIESSFSHNLVTRNSPRILSQLNHAACIYLFVVVI